MTTRWVTVHNAESAVEAQAALDYLHAHEIDARSLPHPDPHLAAAPVSPGWGVIQVPALLQSDAVELLRRWEEEAPRALVVEPKARATQSSTLLGDLSPRDPPAWAQSSGSPPWLWWALILSVLANVVLASLWWEAERRAERPASGAAP